MKLLAALVLYALALTIALALRGLRSRFGGPREAPGARGMPYLGSAPGVA